MRGHFAVGFKSGEEGEEGRGECVDTLQWDSFEHGRCRGVRGRERIIYGTRGGSDARARHPRTTFFPMKKLFVSHSCPFVVLLFHLSCISCISWFIPSSTYARLNGREGAPTRASHALPSTLFSLPYPILKQSPRKDIIWNSILWVDYRICKDL